MFKSSVSDFIIDGLLDGLREDQILEDVHNQFVDAKSTYKTVRYWQKMINYARNETISRGRLMYELCMQNKPLEEIHSLANSRFPAKKVKIEYVRTFVSNIRRVIRRLEIRNE